MEYSLLYQGYVEYNALYQGYVEVRLGSTKWEREGK